MKPIIEGLYTVSKDVRMPYSDKRKSRDWRAEPVIRAGREFIVRAEPKFAGPDETVLQLCIGARDDNFWGLHSVRVDDRDYADLIDALEPLKDNTIDGVLDRYGLKKRDLLDELLERGHVTVEALERIGHEMHEKTKAQWVGVKESL